jgi:DNA-binding Xre family transcriptional regulator
VPLSLNGGGALALKPKERLWSFSFVELLLEYCKDLSYRSATHKLNLTLHRSQDQELIPGTLADFIGHCGGKISMEMKNIADRILRQFGFDPSTCLPAEEASLPIQIVKPSYTGEDGADGHEDRLSDQITAINAQREEEAKITRLELARQIEPSAKNCCYISIDDIGVKHQKDKREDGFVKERKYIENTVIHVQADGRSYCLTAVGMDQAFSILLAFLLANKLMENRRLIFFTDGATDIKLWILCIDKGINKTKLREMSGLSPAVIARLSKGEVVNMESLLQIADVLKCSIADLVDSVPSDEQSENK